MKSRLARSIGLFGFLMALYFCTYQGRSVSGDEQIMLDGALSFYRNGSLELAYFNELRPYFPAPPNRVVLSMDVEPLQSYLAAALMWLAAHFPQIGLVHAAWTLNLWVTAATAVLLYDFGIVLGYSDRTALSTAFLFGVATIAWPYSGLFFREPLFTLLALACANFLTRWRISRRKSGLLWLFGAGLAFAGALLTKGIALLLIPAFLILILPHLSRRTIKLAIIAFVSTVVFAVCLFTLYGWIAPGVRYRFASAWLAQVDLSYIGVALPAWLISPGFSIWVFSPILLIAPIGANYLWRQRLLRQFAFPLMLSASLMLGYCVLQGRGWYSGLGWGPRYMVPLTPFLVLWLLPVIEHYAYRRRLRYLMFGIAAFSTVIQIVASYVPVETFSTALFEQSMALHRSIVPWQDGVWSIAYTPLVVSLQQFSHVTSEIAWVVTHTGVIVIPLCLITAAVSLFSILRFQLLSILVIVLVPLMITIGLSSYYYDPRYGGDNAYLWHTLDRLNSELKPGDALLLNDPAYRGFFTNYFKSRFPVYVMPLAPGERSTPDQPPETITDNLDAQVHPYTWTFLSRLARKTSRWWFFTEFNPYSRNRLRSNEHFLAVHFFQVQEVINFETVRLVEFAPFTAPATQIPPMNLLDVDYGAAHLVGFDMPRGHEFKPSALMPISLLWKQQGWPSDLEPLDYSVNVTLIDAKGLTVVQWAGTPVATFGLMTTWKKGELYRDNHALALPGDLKPGIYRVWVSVYDWRTAKNLPLRNVNQPTDHSVITEIVVLDNKGPEHDQSQAQVSE